VSERPFDIRLARPSDLAFVKNAWLESFKVRALAKIEREVDKLARAHVTVACDHEDDDTLLAFAAAHDGVLHYAYVKEPMRGHGIARALIESLAIEAYSFRTDIGERRLQPKERGWEYRPRIVL
jgi:GNAT superfamily N-acetyltransferase